MKKTVITILLLSILLSVIPYFSVCAEEETVEDEIFTVDSQFAVIINADTGTELFAKNENTPIFCGFLPRLMTCILLLESGLELDKDITLTREMMAVSHDKSSAELNSGNVISLRDLMKCVIVGNSQEAAICIAMTVCSTVTDFVLKMNERARELGAENTVFLNVTGQYSSSTKQTTTVSDIAKITAHALTLDYIEDYSNKRYIEFTVNGTIKSLFNKNALVDANSSYYYKKASGLAISGSSESGYALASVASDKTMKLISVAVTYNTVASLYADMVSMLDFSLNEYSFRVLVQKSAPVCEVPVTYGKERDFTTLIAEKAITASLPSSVKDSEITVIIDSPEILDAPIAKGTVLGTVSYYYEGRLCGTTSLLAQSNITLDIVASYSDKIQNFFANKYVLAIIITVVLVIAAYSLLLYILNKKKIREQQRKSRSRIRPPQ